MSLFVVSDTVLALGRFVEPRSWTRPVTMLTYHGAQALIVAGLLTSRWRPADLTVAAC